MFLPYTRAASVGSFKIPVASAATDVTPNAVNWGNISYDGTTWTYTTQQITGINTPIILQISFSATYSFLRYKVNSTNTVPTGSTQPGSAGYISITQGGTFSVSNNQWVAFGTNDAISKSQSATVSVINLSDANTVLDTFTTSTQAAAP